MITNLLSMEVETVDKQHLFLHSFIHSLNAPTNLLLIRLEAFVNDHFLDAHLVELRAERHEPLLVVIAPRHGHPELVYHDSETDDKREEEAATDA